MAVVTQLLVAVAVLAALMNLASADRCSEICSQENFSDQCGTCLGRAPVRFGKRSPSDINNVNRELLADLPPAALLSLLLQTATQLQARTRAHVHGCDRNTDSVPPCAYN